MSNWFLLKFSSQESRSNLYKCFLYSKSLPPSNLATWFTSRKRTPYDRFIFNVCILVNPSLVFSRLRFGSWSFCSVQLLSCVRLCATPWIAACQASLSITNSWSLPKLMPIELVMPSIYLILCCPLLLLPPIPPSIRVFSNESTLHMRWPKYWSFSFSISPSKEHPGLISFRMDWLDLLAVQGLSRVFSNTTVQKHQFFSVQLSSQWSFCINSFFLLLPSLSARYRLGGSRWDNLKKRKKGQDESQILPGLPFGSLYSRTNLFNSSEL